MSVSAVIDSTGISSPTYNDILADLQNRYRTIFGNDIVVSADSQDGQFLAILALVLSDTYDLAVAVFNSFSPANAQGAGLAALVKINGMRKLIPSFSQVVLTVVGPVGGIIVGGMASGAGTTWSLPAIVLIPDSGQVDVTAVALISGAIRAAPGSITTIVTPMPEWQTVTNAAASIPGQPVETDAALRRRQTLSTAMPAKTLRESIYARIAQVADVERVAVFDNDTDRTDDAGIPPHSIGVVVKGGDLQVIATAIALTKSPGTGTFGSSDAIVFDSRGVPNKIHISFMREIAIVFRVTISPLIGYVSTTAPLIINAIVEYINELAIHDTVYHNRLWGPANLLGSAAVRATGLPQTTLELLSATYNVQLIEIGMSVPLLATNNIVIDFDAAAVGVAANGSVIVS